MKRSIPTSELYTELDDILARSAQFFKLGNIGKGRSLKAEAEAIEIRLCYRQREEEYFTCDNRQPY